MEEGPWPLKLACDFSVWPGASWFSSKREKPRSYQHQSLRALRRFQCSRSQTGYALAREAQADKLFKECLEIADRGSESENENPQRIQRDRLRIDARKWMAARLAPKKYGDHISHDAKGGGINFQPQILIQCSSAGDDEGYIDISAAPEKAGGPPQQGNGNSLRGGRR